MSIIAEGLCKRFDEREVVRGLELEVRPGEIYGLIGPNGAGKTTTMRMLVGLLRPSAGRALICGEDIERRTIRAQAKIGFVSGTTGLYERLTPRELLGYFGRLFGVSPEDLRRRAARLADELQFAHLLDRRCGKLSGGERQRVSLARASIHDPEVMVFDEPTAGLDVVASRFVAEFIRRARERQRAILFSTHYMTEAELLCDRIGMIDCGELLVEGAPAVLKGRAGAETLEQLFLQLHDERGASAPRGEVS